jgi:hypothetical protein
MLDYDTLARRDTRDRLDLTKLTVVELGVENSTTRKYREGQVT